MMAEAQGKLTGQPGICFVTRGPGATNASAGVHIAHQDSTPMILLVRICAMNSDNTNPRKLVHFRPLWRQQLALQSVVLSLFLEHLHRALGRKPSP